MKAITIEAKVEKLDDVLAAIASEVEAAGCPLKNQMKLEVAVEEIFANIANYAYGDEEGDAEISIDTDEEHSKVVICFKDSGQKFNPLEREDPDITLPAEERGIGGLGIYMVKQMMDDVDYRYEDGKNIFTITYSWG